LSGIVEADETFILESSRAGGPICRDRRESGSERPNIRGSIRTTFPSSPTTERRDFRRGPVSSRQRFDRGRPRQRDHARQSPGRRRRQGDRRFRPQSRDSVPRRANAGKVDSRGAAPAHLVNAYHGRLKQWLYRFNGVATKNLPNYPGWRRALEAWGGQLAPQTWIKGAIGNGPY
jgi:hypothetical protein